MESQDWSRVIAAEETTTRLNSTRRMPWQKLRQCVVKRTVKSFSKINV